MMVIFGIGAAPAGLWLGNGLGPKFGTNQSKGKVDRTAAFGAYSAVRSPSSQVPDCFVIVHSGAPA